MQKNIRGVLGLEQSSVEGEVLLIIFPLKEKEPDILRDSIQLGAIKV